MRSESVYRKPIKDGLELVLCRLMSIGKAIALRLSLVLKVRDDEPV